MIHQDPSILSNNNPSPPPAPTPAVPILGNHLLELEEKQRTRFTGHGRPERVKTGCSEIDDVLGGEVEGVERGIVVGISSPEGEEGILLSLNLLATLLLSHLSSAPGSSNSFPVASIIDTTGTFPLSLLAKILKSRLASDATTKNRDIDASIQRCLEMVNVTRVFDIEGVWEVLSEISHAASIPTPTPEIPSSDASAISILRHSAQNIVEDNTGIEIIVITNLTPPIHALFGTRSKTSAHDFLALLARTIHTLSSSLNILTLLHNSVVPVRSNFPSGDQPPKNQQAPKSVSVFASNPLKPALGQIFAQFPSLHLLLSPMPKRKEDADLLYAGDGSSSTKINYTTILEVLKDETPILGSDRQPPPPTANPPADSTTVKRKKFGSREQHWTALEPNADGTALICSFQDTGTMRGMGLSRERDRIGGLTEGGKIVKMHGFGGRRV